MIRKNFPSAANVIRLAGNLILRTKKLGYHSCKNGLTGSAIQLTFKIKYRYYIGESRCERPITGEFMGRAKKFELYKL